jgi:hypothetical protein
MTSGERPRLKLSINDRQPADVPTLAGNFSNLDAISGPVFRHALAGINGTEVRRETVTALMQLQQTGTGINSNLLPPPLLQSDLECQTMALLNGIQAWGGRERVADLIPQIPEIHQRADNIVRHRGYEDGRFYMTVVDEILEDRGLLQYMGEGENPVDVARQLFEGNRFLGVASEKAFHAYTILPLEKSDNPLAFALKIDSLDGQALISPEGFLNLVVSKPENENRIVYLVI